MRHLILALMIALLPIRGWVGDVMATEMASGRTAHIVTGTDNAIETIADHAHTAGAKDNFDHGSAAQQMMVVLTDCEGNGHDSSPAEHASCEACAACQSCHTVALSPTAAVASPMLTPLASPSSPLARFASADAAQGQKPPIS